MIATTITITNCHSCNHAQTNAAAASTFAIARHDMSNNGRRSGIMAELLEQRSYSEQHSRGHHSHANGQPDYRRNQLKKSSAHLHIATVMESTFDAILRLCLIIDTRFPKSTSERRS
jgi:hypothetical protein